ncbi:uncharacterized protein LOC120465044 [Pimephales promelas]|uniref:uncharacterized protein LOC120465044 n=1 Tax=Pimephales promelas TaxID=90988 RepID=UPI00195579CC|nr:uncharacterized protein LOC120465044 [Pimephales promelas]
MMTYRIPVLIFFAFNFYGSFGKDTVNQPSETQTGTEGQQVTLSCEYETLQTAPYLFWYIQRSDGLPEYILMKYKFGSSSSSEFEDRFDARLDSNSVILTIQDFRSEISTWRGVFSDRIGPSDEDSNKIRREGESVKLSCTYDTTSNNIWLYWFRQYPNREPQYLLYKGARSYSGEDKTDERFQSTTSQTSTELTINSATLSDSALYYCALRVVAQ